MLISFGLFNFIWHGGITPRYVRNFQIPILLLSFFSFYYIQKTKNIFIKLIFFLLIILSILNVSSIAIRADWTYMHEADLVSSDLILWPWLNPKEKISNETMIQITSAEIPKWILKGEEDCKASFGSMGLLTDPCFCIYDSWAERRIKLERNMSKIEIRACASTAGNDGTKGLIFIDEKPVGEIYIKSNSCSKEIFQVDISEGEHKIKLKSGINGTCDAEATFWKSIRFR
jgi:hypothetical protein